MDSKSPMPNPTPNGGQMSLCDPGIIIYPGGYQCFFLSETNKDVKSGGTWTSIFSRDFLSDEFADFEQILLNDDTPSQPVRDRARPSLKAQSKGPVRQWDIVNIQRHNK